MYSVAFIFEPWKYGDEFHTLDNSNLEVAKSMNGYVGKESWQSADGKRLSSTYYWSNEKSIKEFSSPPKHIEEKRQCSKWHNGYHVVISKIERSYGNNFISHVTPNERAKNV